MRLLSLSRHAAVATIVAASVLLLPAAATASSTAATASTAPTAATATPACTVTDASITWGFKETFRSYISGTIAHGQWETTGGASYTTPVFGWTGGTGTYDAETSTGQVTFPGGIHFTGHGGLLDSTVQNPTIVFAGPGTARLLFDVSGTLMEDALAGVENTLALEQVPFVEIDLSAAAVAEQDGVLTLTATDAPTAITAEGYDAFGNYPAGTAFDPMTIVVSAECAPEVAPVVATPEPTEPPEVTDTALVSEESGPDLAWIPWVLGGAAVALLIVWLTRRRMRRASEPSSGADK